MKIVGNILLQPTIRAMKKGDIGYVNESALILVPYDNTFHLYINMDAHLGLNIDEKNDKRIPIAKYGDTENDFQVDLTGILLCISLPELILAELRKSLIGPFTFEKFELPDLVSYSKDINLFDLVDIATTHPFITKKTQEKLKKVILEKVYQLPLSLLQDFIDNMLTNFHDTPFIMEICNTVIEDINITSSTESDNTSTLSNQKVVDRPNKTVRMPQDLRIKTLTELNKLHKKAIKLEDYENAGKIIKEINKRKKNK